MKAVNSEKTDTEISVEYTTGQARAILLEKRKSLKTNPASQLIGEYLSPTRGYLQFSAMERPRLEDSETYYRSQKHPIVKKLAQKGRLMYCDKPLKNGEDAHVGAYGNFFQLMGDVSLATNTNLTTSVGDGVLYNQQLKYRNGLCTAIFNKAEDLIHIKVAHYNDFPCLMVFIYKETILKDSDTSKPSNEVFEEWVNLLIGFVVALVNFYAYEDKLPIEMQRRSGFGFLTPTIAPTGCSLRINIGIVPEAYALLVLKALRKLDEVLQEILTKPAVIPKLPQGLFFQSEEHKRYLGLKYQKAKPTNVIQLLWTQVEKTGKRTVQNINRSSFARDGFSACIFGALVEGKSPLDSFFSAVKWAIERIHIESSGNRTSLVFNQEGTIAYSKRFSKCKTKIEDSNFWSMINLILSRAKQHNAAIDPSVFSVIASCCETKCIDALYFHLELLNELIFSEAVEHSLQEDIGEGYGSDSEDECVFPMRTLYSKKVITHNGMRAIWGAIIAAEKHLSENKIECRVYLEQAYYEVPLGLQLIARLHDAKIDVVKKFSLASIIVYDLNACITNGVITDHFILEEKNKVIILDCTSASSVLVNQHLEHYAKSRATVLFLVDSGFKNQQNGADKNQYGTIRMVTTTKVQRNDFYNMVKSIEPPLLSKTSHLFRRTMKKIGAVPTTDSYFRPKLR
ncbi:MAG: hypothetical protein A3F10_00610 [Coxiella sp. RIFCSPHIGHO2_12_FULL_42_15]|nr:MAG: hypothetical protein A3F10_00610 [Coxiella sp. RIFCSPHIGHO2_12_FULL_42_15]